MTFVGIDQAIYGVKDMALGRRDFTDWGVKSACDFKALERELAKDRDVSVDKQGTLTRTRRDGARRAVKFR